MSDNPLKMQLDEASQEVTENLVTTTFYPEQPTDYFSDSHTHHILIPHQHPFLTSPEITAEAHAIANPDARAQWCPTYNEYTDCGKLKCCNRITDGIALHPNQHIMEHDIGSSEENLLGDFQPKDSPQSSDAYFDKVGANVVSDLDDGSRNHLLRNSEDTLVSSSRRAPMNTSPNYGTMDTNLDKIGDLIDISVPSDNGSKPREDRILEPRKGDTMFLHQYPVKPKISGDASPRPRQGGEFHRERNKLESSRAKTTNEKDMAREFKRRNRIGRKNDIPNAEPGEVNRATGPSRGLWGNAAKIFGRKNQGILEASQTNEQLEEANRKNIANYATATWRAGVLRAKEEREARMRGEALSEEQKQENQRQEWQRRKEQREEEALAEEQTMLEVIPLEMV